MMSTLPESNHMNSTSVGPFIDDLTPIRFSVQRLRNTLRLNACTSSVGGLVCLVAGGWSSTLLGVGQVALVRIVGLGLILFAGAVAAVAGSPVTRLTRWAQLVSVADAMWVVATAVTVLAGWYSTTGIIVVSLVGLMVASFGVAQLRTWKDSRSAIQTGSASNEIHLRANERK